MGERALDVGLEAQALAERLLHLGLEHRRSDPCPPPSRCTSRCRRCSAAPRRPLSGVESATPTLMPTAHVRFAERRMARPGRSTSSCGRPIEILAGSRSPRAGPRTRRPPAAPPCRSCASSLTSRSATACSSRSPASWPSVSLTFLKSSRSRNITATCRALASSQRRARARRDRGTGCDWPAASADRGTPAPAAAPRGLALADVAEVQRQALHRRVARSGCCRRFRASNVAGARSTRSSTGPTARPASPRPRRETPSAARRPSPLHSSSRFRPTTSSGFRPNVRSKAGDAKRSAPSASTIMMTSDAFAMSDA